LRQPQQQLHYGFGYICKNIIVLLYLLVKPSLPSQLDHVLLDPCDHQCHCEKRISYCIHDKSILPLGHLGAFSSRIKGVWLNYCIYKIANLLLSFYSNKSFWILEPCCCLYVIPLYVVNALIFVKVVRYPVISNCIYVVSCFQKESIAFAGSSSLGFNIEP
jgi:hypothetical protein